MGLSDFKFVQKVEFLTKSQILNLTVTIPLPNKCKYIIY